MFSLLWNTVHQKKTVSINPDFANFVAYETFFKVDENVLIVQFQFILPNAHPNRFVLRKHESNSCSITEECDRATCYNACHNALVPLKASK